jgi:serine phosphatase RsbU (regulator of sigma subunit)
MRTIITIAFCGFIFITNISAQKTKLDSIWNRLEVHDTVKIQDIVNYGIEIQKRSLDTALVLHKAAVELADEALTRYSNPTIIRALSISKSIALRCIGIVFYYQGAYDKAIEHYLESLRISEVFDDKNGMSSCYNNIGMIYSFQKDFEPAIDNYQKALKIKEDLDDKFGVAACITNIGIVYFYKANQLLNSGNKQQAKPNYEKAIEYYSKSLKIYQDLNDLRWISACYNNIGIAYKEQEKYDKALDFYQKSLAIKEELNDKFGMLSSLINLSSLNITLADSFANNSHQKLRYLNNAVDFGTQALKLSKEISTLPRESEAARELMMAYSKLGDFEKAFEYAQLFISTKDSIFNTEKTKSIAEMKTKYETEKHQQEIEKQRLIIEKNEIESSRQRIRQNFLIAGSILLFIVVLLVLFAYRQKYKSSIIISEKNALLEQYNEEIKATSDALSAQNKQLKEQNEEITTQRNEIESQRNSLANLAWELQEQGEEIEKQKNILSIKNKEITDSIFYAQRIQSAVLPSSDFLAHYFSEHFILYRPKSIVSGDFYWATRIGELLIFCVTDCTGHGVPGAFMSMLGVSFLNEIIRKEENTNPAKVLVDLREHVMASMMESKGSSIQFDGMDIGLCVIDTTSLMLQFAGANIPCWIAAGSANEEKFTERVELLNGLIELKPDKMPIARYEKMEEFTIVEYQLEKGDIIYVASDGFADQFGGQDGKKYQKSRLIELISQNSTKKLAEQKQILEVEFEKWKGSRSQLDDVTLMGVKV